MCEELRDPPGGARPRPAFGPSPGDGAFSLMMLSWFGSMVVAASRMRAVEPKIG
jgi:hypothetical protein